MKLKELREIQRNMALERKLEYLEKNQIDKEEYFKAENKQRSIGTYVFIGLWLAVLSLCVIGNCAKNTDDIKHIEPVVINRADLGQPYSAFNPNSYIDFYNYDNAELQYVNINGTSQPNYILEFDEGFVRLPYKNTGNASIYVVDLTETDGYWLSDDFNVNSFNDGITTSEESFNGSLIAHYGNLASDMYINLHTPNISDIYTKWLFNEYMAVNVNRSITKIIDYGNFNLDFKDDYINSYNTFNAIKIEANIKTIDYGYRLAVSLSAFNKTNSYQTLIATTYYSSKASNNTILRNSNGTYSLSLKNASNLDYRDDFVTMPYLKSLKIHSTSNHPYERQSTQLGFRSWLDYNGQLNQTLPNTLGMGDIDNDRYAETLWSNFGDLIKITFTSLLPMAGIVILPGITLGAIVVAPFVIGLVILMLRLVKKD